MYCTGTFFIHSLCESVSLFICQFGLICCVANCFPTSQIEFFESIVKNFAILGLNLLANLICKNMNFRYKPWTNLLLS